MNPLVTKLVNAIGPSRKQPLSAVLRKVAANLHALGCARAWLRACDSVGANARSFGRPYIDNLGSIVLGNDVAVNCKFATVLLGASASGRLEIGDGVTINYGSYITAAEHVRLGKRVMVGPYCVVSDLDGAPGSGEAPQPVEIGDDVWLAARVVVRPGSRIGEGAVIAAGSVVDGDIPPFAIVSGSPARVLRIHRASSAPPPPQSGVVGRIPLPEAVQAEVREVSCAEGR